MQRTHLKKERIDWQVVRHRLQASEQAIEQSLTPAAQRIEDVYRARAVKLAQPEQHDSFSAGLPVLVFRLGQERYAIEMQHLAEVLPFGYHAPVPGSPEHVLGVISFRGELRAVVDLRRLLAPSSEGTNPAGFILMLRAGAGQEQIGLKIDAVETLGEIRREDLQPPAPGSFVTGLVSGTLALLNVNAVMANVCGNGLSRHDFPGNARADEESST